jgi:hypothetical protein
MSFHQTVPVQTLGSHVVWRTRRHFCYFISLPVSQSLPPEIASITQCNMLIKVCRIKAPRGFHDEVPIWRNTMGELDFVVIDSSPSQRENRALVHVSQSSSSPNICRHSCCWIFKSCNCGFLVAFANFEKRLSASSYMSVRPSVRASTWNNSAHTGRIWMKLDIWAFLETLSRNYV